MTLTLFKDPLPIPTVLQPDARYKTYNYYEISMEEFKHQMHSELPPTKVWGYEGMFPGPTIETKRGEYIRVKWKNNLPENHFLPIDRTVHGAGVNYPDVRTVVHLHGAEVEPESDGYPEAWFTRDYEKTGARFEKEVYEYPNSQRATALWYHDHAFGITRLNIYAGLAGMYIIRDEHERKLNLPSGRFEIPLIIQDRSFNEDGSLFYPNSPNISDPPPDFPEPSVTPGIAGNNILVNGKVWPYLEVEQRKYRFRILNASNERFYRIKLSNGDNFIQIGTDGGLLEQPVEMNEILIGPSERVDVIIDFSDIPVDTRLELRNDAETPFPFGAPPDPETTGKIMQFRVIPASSDDNSIIPSYLGEINKLKECDASLTRDITLDVDFDQYGRLKLLLNNRGFMDRITEIPKLGDTEIWCFINPGIATHPMHIHLIQFQIIDRIPFDTDLFNERGQLTFTVDPELPPPNERGWKDTVQSPPGYVTRVIAKFGPYSGRYIFHCHILEHEDYDMMRPYEVVFDKNQYYKKINKDLMEHENITYNSILNKYFEFCQDLNLDW